MLENYKDILTVRDICDILNISKSTAYKLLQSKEIPNMKMANKYVIPKIGVIKIITNITL